MKLHAGLWIDHREAVIVTLNEAGETVEHVASHAGKREERSAGGSQGAFESQKVKADDSRQHSLTEHLNTYYDAVIDSLPNIEGVLCFGPGEAKTQLKQRMVEKHWPGHLAPVETVDRMTEPQIVAKVKEHFLAAL